MTATGGIGSGYDWWNDPRSTPYHAALTKAAAETNGRLTSHQMANLIGGESSFDASAKNSSSSATGIAQILAGTAKNPGSGLSSVDPSDPEASILFAGKYIGRYGVRQYSGGTYSTNDLNTKLTNDVLSGSTQDTATKAGVSSFDDYLAKLQSGGPVLSSDVSGETPATVESGEGLTGIAAIVSEYSTRLVVILLGLIFVAGALFMMVESKK